MSAPRTRGRQRRRRKAAPPPAKPQRAGTAPLPAGETAVIVTRHQLAAILGCHPDRVSEYSHAGMPILHRGGVGGAEERRRNRYDAIACAQWVRSHRPGSFDAQAEKAALDRKRREEIEFRLQAKRGELVPAVDVKRAAFETARTVRDNLMNIPDRVAAELATLTDPHDVHLRLEREIRQALETLSELIRPPEAT